MIHVKVKVKDVSGVERPNFITLSNLSNEFSKEQVYRAYCAYIGSGNFMEYEDVGELGYMCREFKKKMDEIEDVRKKEEVRK